MLTVVELQAALADAVKAHVGRLLENAALAMAGEPERSDAPVRFQRGLNNLIAAHKMASATIERAGLQEHVAASPACPDCGAAAANAHAADCAHVKAVEIDMLARVGKYENDQ